MTLPNERKELIDKILLILKEQLGIKNLILITAEKNSLIILRCQRTEVPDVIKLLNKNGIGTIEGLIDILKLSASIPPISMLEKEQDKTIEPSYKKRVSIEEIEQYLEGKIQLNFNYIIFILLSAIIAGAGLILNSPVFIIASMILSPLIGPILGLSFGIVSKNKPMVKKGIINQIIGLSLSIGIGSLLGILAIIIYGTPEVTTEMLLRNFPNYFDIIIAICAGIAVGFVITEDIKSTLIGIAIAASITPPAVNIGISLIYNEWSLCFGSLLLLIANILIINICAVCVFKLKKIGKIRQPYIFWRGPEETIDNE
ncbi:MAG: TIGR00341 family protein [Promethearchaeota archaeon]